MLEQLMAEFNSLYVYRQRLIRSGTIRTGQLIPINRKLRRLSDKIKTLMK